MSDPVTKAKEEVRIFERPSKKTAEEMIEEIERLRDLLDRAYLDNKKYGYIKLKTCIHIEDYWRKREQGE